MGKAGKRSPKGKAKRRGDDSDDDGMFLLDLNQDLDQEKETSEVIEEPTSEEEEEGGSPAAAAAAAAAAGGAAGAAAAAAAISCGVVGGGTAGLAAAERMHRAGADVLLLEARGRLGGRVHSTHLPPRGDLPAVQVDLGANYIHGAGFEGHPQPIWARAIQQGTVTALAPGRHWENTQVCRWYDEKTGAPIKPGIILKIHAIATKVQGRLGRLAQLAQSESSCSPKNAKKSPKNTAKNSAKNSQKNSTKEREETSRLSVLDRYEEAVEYVCKRHGGGGLITQERGILDTIMTKAIGYVGGLGEVALGDLKEDADIGVEDDPDFGDAAWVAEGLKDYMETLEDSEPPLF